MLDQKPTLEYRKPDPDDEHWKLAVRLLITLIVAFFLVVSVVAWLYAHGWAY
jgi:uncharacterized membrane protein